MSAVVGAQMLDTRTHRRGIVARAAELDRATRIVDEFVAEHPRDECFAARALGVASTEHCLELAGFTTGKRSLAVRGRKCRRRRFERDSGVVTAAGDKGDREQGAAHSRSLPSRCRLMRTMM